MGSSSGTATRTRSAFEAGRNDRRTLILAAGLLAGVIIAGMVVVALSVDEGPRTDTQGQLAEQGGAKPHIIPRPNDGHPPEDPGDRGGWEQLSLFGVLAVAIVGIGVMVFRGGRSARANRAAWRAAAATGRDGALDRDGHPTHQPGDRSPEPAP